MINPNSMLLQLSPLPKLDFGNGSASLERQNLELMKAKFEEEKRWHAQQAENDRLAAQAQLAGKALERQKALEQQEAERKAALLAQQQAGQLKFAEAAGNMNVEQTAALSPYLESLGIGVDNLGQVGGLPSYRIYNRAEDQARQDQELLQSPRAIDPFEGEGSALQSLNQMNALGLGYPGNERGSLEEPAGIGSTEDAFNRAKEAQQLAADTGAPARGPDEEDYMGAVPRDVIDMGAMHAQTLARLNPALKAYTEGYTEDPDLQAQAEKAAEVARASGLPADKALELARQTQEPHDQNYRMGLQLEAQQAKFRETRDDLTEKDKARMRKDGRFAAEQRAKDDDVQGGVKALRTIDEMEDILDNEGPGSAEDDTMIAGALMSIQDVKGIPSDKDLAYAFGMGKASAISQIVAKVQEVVKGGFSDVQRQAIKNFIARVKQSQEEKIETYLDSTEPDMLGDMNEHEQEGYRGVAKRLVPGFYYNRWQDKRKGKKEDDAGEPRPIGSNTGSDPEFDKALDEGARAAGVDPEKIRPLIRHESGGDPAAVSSEGASGVLQIMPSNLRAMGIEPEAFRKLSATEQVPYVVRFFKERGLTADSTPEDYAMAVAASDPKFRTASDDTVVYPKDSAGWKANKPWRPPGDGDITKGSILKFYGLRGSGKGKERKADNENPFAGMPEPKNESEKRLRAIMERSR